MSSESDRFERVTRTILEQCRDAFGYTRVDPKGKLRGKSGTEWEIDAIAFLPVSNDFVLIECRRRSSKKIEQGQVGELIFRVQDTGAASGLIVTTVGAQEGAKLVAKAHKIGLGTLNLEATERDYVLDVAGRLFHGIEGKGGLAVSGTAATGVTHNIQGSGGLGLGGTGLNSITRVLSDGTGS